MYNNTSPLKFPENFLWGGMHLRLVIVLTQDAPAGDYKTNYRRRQTCTTTHHL